MTTEILDAAEAAMRRFGPEKLTVVDVARALGMSHANVYRFYPSKAALIDALVGRWLERIEAPLRTIAEGDVRPPERLKLWARTLHQLKREKVTGDPELFDAHRRAIAASGQAAVDRHLTRMREQVQRILSDGVAMGFFASDKPEYARAVFTAITPFSDPRLMAEGAPDRSEELAMVMMLIVAGLRAL